MSKIVGKVTQEESKEIHQIFLKRKSLIDMLNIVNNEDSDIYNMLMDDIVSTDNVFQKWWHEKSQKYSWEKSENGRWKIDFETCNIYLVTPEEI